MKTSIIMSTYLEYANGALSRAVNSVRAQTYTHWELIIVGDCTPYEKEIAHFVKLLGDERIFFKNLHARTGLASPGTVPKQEGIARSTGGLLAFLDADNEYFTRHLECSIKEFIADPGLDLVYGDMVVRMARNRKTPLGPDCPRTVIARSKATKQSKVMAEIRDCFVGSRLLAMTKTALLDGLEKKKDGFTQFIWKKPEWNEHRATRLLSSNFLDMSLPVFTRAAYNASWGLTTKHHAADWMLWKAFLDAGKNNFKHSPHCGLVYYTSSLKHHLCYLALMLAQKSGIGYTSENIQWMQKGIQKRFEKKYTC